MKKSSKKFLSNKIGRWFSFFSDFTNAAEYWTFPFESINIRQEAENVWTEILPLYELIHAYVRRKLREFYGPNRINRNAPLPDHVLGNMYAQTWTNILDITIPFPGRSFLDVTPDMIEQGYTPLVMFQLAEEFFLSINMTALPTDFWLDSVLERPPPDRPVLCQPSAWDFCDGKTYRIKMCTNVNHKDLITVHHEMAHIQYFMNYRHQPKVFRDGANAGKIYKTLILRFVTVCDRKFAYTKLFVLFTLVLFFRLCLTGHCNRSYEREIYSLPTIESQNAKQTSSFR